MDTAIRIKQLTGEVQCAKETLAVLTRERSKLINEWAEAAAKFKWGQILENQQGTRLLVKRIKGNLALDSTRVVQITYEGPRLNRRGEPDKRINAFIGMWEESVVYDMPTRG